jgi:uncharacterized DUF497 family protein
MRIEYGHKLQFRVGSQKSSGKSNKHVITFDEAATVYRYSKALSIFHPDHSESEDRWVTMGISERGRLLIVIHTFREESEDDVTIRIISSRKATKQETKNYGE